MRLTPGTQAPEFELPNWTGERVRLSDYRGKKLWLGFYRYASCPLCNLRIRDIIRRHEELTRGGLSVLAVFQSPPQSVAEYVGQQKPPFPLLCDPEEKIYKLYGVEANLGAFVSPANIPYAAKATAAGFLPGRMEGTKTRIPADFLVSPEGKIAHAFYGKVIGDHIPFEEVEKFLGA